MKNEVKIALGVAALFAFAVLVGGCATNGMTTATTGQRATQKPAVMEKSSNNPSASVPEPKANDANGTLKGIWALGSYQGTIEFTLTRDGKKLTGVVTELTGMPHDPGRRLSGYIKKNWVLLDFEDGNHQISATLTDGVLEGELSSRYNRGTIRVERVK